jgi:D-arginine dehydrogenase
MSETADVVIIGGGIAGVSAGYYLADAGLSVHLVEAEPTLAYHTTGRSAAQYLENYGSQVVRKVTIAGKSFFADPPELADTLLWSPRAMLSVGGPEMVDQLRRDAEEAKALTPSTEFVGSDEVVRLCPVLRPELVGGALFEPEAMDLDVAAIHQTFLRGLRTWGGTVSTSSSVTDLDRTDSGWRITAGDLVIDTAVVVNAAGAWCDRVGQLAGVSLVGLRPLRRTACVLAVADDIDTTNWPLVGLNGHGADMQGYMKPEPGGLMVSPADEVPSDPCDAKPEEIDVARGLDAVARWTTLDTRHVRSTWAGLRSFVADRTLVAGFAPDGPGFFWLTGQGGYGIHTSPGLGRAACGLIVDGRLPDDLQAAGLTEADLAPDRPGLAGELVTAH